jgi:1-acyl-sn-glycerol-3-phosphate acyltransferase
MAVAHQLPTCADGARNLVHYGGLALLTLITIVLSPPLYLILRRLGGATSGQAVRRIIWVYGRAWTWLLRLVVPVRISTGDAADYPAPCIIVANHQSFFDAFCMGALPIYDLVFVVRSWPFRIPFYGPYMRRGEYLNSEHLSCDEFLDQAVQRLNNGISVIIFPEGTRSPDGQLGRFYSGAFKLSLQTGVPVIPVCLRGMGDFLPRGGVWLRKASITIKKMVPVFPADFKAAGPGAHLTMRKHVKALLATALREPAE